MGKRGPKRRFTDEERRERQRRCAEEGRKRIASDPILREVFLERAREKSRKYREKNPEYQKRYVEKNRRYLNSAKRFTRTGWTEEDVQAAWVEQDGRCALCEILIEKKGVSPTSMTADHDHETGRKRGLLCRRCNILEGHHLEVPIDEEEWGRRVKAYRLKYRAKAAGVIPG